MTFISIFIRGVLNLLVLFLPILLFSPLDIVTFASTMKIQKAAKTKTKPGTCNK